MGRPMKNPRFPRLHERVLEMGGVEMLRRRYNFPRQSYYYYQSGINEPGLSSIIRLLNITGLSFDEAFLNKRKEKE